MMDPALESPRDAEQSRKRPLSPSQIDQEHPAKRQSDAPLVILRVVCPHDKSGPVIGKGGEVIRAIRDSTGARIKLEEMPRGMHERVVIVTSADRPGEPSCPAQEALARVISRIFESDGPEGPTVPTENTEMKMLVDKAYVGLIVGKGGDNISKVRANSGAKVSVLNGVNKSPLAGPDEESILVAGPYDSMKIAINLIIDKIREGVARGMKPAPSTLALSHVAPMPAGGIHSMLPPHGPPPPQHHGPPPGGPPGPPPMGAIHTEYRLLVPETRVGGIIGKGGDRLRTIRDGSRAEVRVERGVEGCEERLVVCSSHEPVESEYCAAAEGLMMCAERVVADRNRDPATPAVLRMLAAANQMGAVLGIKGQTVRQISSDTGARLMVLSRDKTPAVGGPHDEVLEITGRQEQVLQAARICTMLLRGIMIRQQQGAPGGPPGGPPAGPPPPSGAPPPAHYPPPPHQHAPPPPYAPSAPPPYTPAPAPSYPGYTSAVPAAAAPPAYSQASAVGPYSSQYGTATTAPATSAYPQAQQQAVAPQPPAQSAYAAYSTQPTYQQQPVAAAPAPSSTQAAAAQPYAAYYALYNTGAAAAPTATNGAAASAPVQVYAYSYPTADASQQQTAAQQPQQQPAYPPQQSGYTYQLPPSSSYADTTTTSQAAQQQQQQQAAYNPYNPPSTAYTSYSQPAQQAPQQQAPPVLPGPPSQPGALAAPPSGPPPIGTLHNPAITSTGLPTGQLRYTMALPPHQVGIVLGSKGSNISAIRMASGSRIKVHDSTTPGGDRDVELTGQPSQVAVAASMIQTLLTTGQMPPK